VLALDVLDQSELERFAIRGTPDDDGDLLQARELRRTQAALSGDQHVGTVRTFADDERLDHAIFADRLGEVRESSVVEVAAGLVVIGLKLLDVREADSRM